MAVLVQTQKLEVRLLQWLLFAVCLGVSSMILRWSFLAFVTHQSQKQAAFAEVLDDGELFVVAVAIAGAALSDIVAGKSHDSLRQVATFVAVLSVMFGAAFYAVV